MRPARLSRLSSLLVLALVATGCGSASTTYTCSPPCPSGWTCSESGCVAASAPGPDLSASLDLASECGGACPQAAPYCKTGTCVPCLTDDHCPAGQICQPIGATTICTAGCTDDSRCTKLQPGLKCCGGECVDATTDPRHCGGCGTACMTPNSGVACAAGQCTAGACNPGYGDCNHDPGDGCEVNLMTDVANCSACGTACTYKNATSGCSGGCYLKACEFGWADCDSSVDSGCETAVLSDPKNCGACNNRCGTLPNAVNTCVNANCQITTCTGTFGNCNNRVMDGCEANLMSDINNCGGCGSVCAKGLVCKNGGCTCPQCNFPNAKSACINLLCTLTACVPGWGDCNGVAKDGCELDVTADVTNCGGCGRTCSKANITPSCVAGDCAGSCNPGFADCNRNLLGDGCECNLATNACAGGACLKKNGQACVSDGQCAAGTCCNGACADLKNDASNCGACGTVCQGLTLYCDAGTCSDNPCTGQAGGDVAAVMGTPLYGLCWYLGIGGATCDTVCSETGGTNEALAADATFPDDCLAVAPDTQVSTWFLDNANACNWDPMQYVATGYHTLGQGYTAADLGGRTGKYVGKCGMGLTNSGTYPGDMNDSVALGSGRCVVCACSH